jgi:formamidopyrimidine-DNA glycosylase
MPELPEVQTVVNDLNAAGLEGAVISGARVYWPRTIATPSVRSFQRQIKGCRISTIWRRGKFLVFDFSTAYHMLIHLRMSGRIHLFPAATQRLKHEHVIISFNDGRQLRFHDTRKFGRIYLLKNPDTILGKLGIEPLAAAFTAKQLIKIIKHRRRLLKPLLLDQSFIAGLGNIYVDEALWEAKIHPCRMASTLSDAEIKMLHRTIPRVLKRGLKNLGTSLGTGKANFYSVARRKGRNTDELKVFRRTGMPCPRCGQAIERIIVGQRSTHICGECQKI